MKTNHKTHAKRKPVMEKPFLEQKQNTTHTADHEHTIFGVHPQHQGAVNKLKHTDPDLWNRIRSWN